MGVTALQRRLPRRYCAGTEVGLIAPLLEPDWDGDITAAVDLTPLGRRWER